MIKENIEIQFGGKPIKISVLKRKSGPRWLLLLHGLQTNKRQFLPLFQNEGFTDYSLLAVDLVGFGKSDKPDDFSYDLVDQTEVVLRVLKATGIDSCSVVGHSLGGMIGTLLLSHSPSQVEKLVSLEGNLVEADCGESLTTSQMPFEAFEAAYEQLKTRLQSDGPSGPIRYFFLELTPAHSFFETSNAIVKWARSEKLKEIFDQSTKPKLMIVGEKSRFKSRPQSDNTKWQAIPAAGHFMLIERTRDTMEAIIKFLK